MRLFRRFVLMTVMVLLGVAIGAFVSFRTDMSSVEEAVFPLVLGGAIGGAVCYWLVWD